MTRRWRTNAARWPAKWSRRCGNMPWSIIRKRAGFMPTKWMASGNSYCTDDGNIPSLLSLPYLGAVNADDPLYQATRRFLLSASNPYYCQGKAANGPGGPHVGMDMIWPLGVDHAGFDQHQ